MALTIAYFLLVIAFGSWDSMWHFAASADASPWWNFWVQGRWAWTALALLLPAPRVFTERWEDLGPGLLWIVVLAIAQWAELPQIEWLVAFALAQVLAGILRTGVEKSLFRPLVACFVLLLIVGLLHTFFIRELTGGLRLNILVFVFLAMSWFQIPAKRGGTTPVLLHPTWSLGGGLFGPARSRRMRRTENDQEHEALWTRGILFSGGALLIWMGLLWCAPFLRQAPIALDAPIWISFQLFASGALALMGFRHASPILSPWRARSPIDFVRRVDFWSWSWARWIGGLFLRKTNFNKSWYFPATAVLAALIGALALHSPWKLWIPVVVLAVVAERLLRRR